MGCCVNSSPNGFAEGVEPGDEEIQMIRDIREIVKLDKKIGAGGSCKVYLVTKKDSNVQYALKIIDNDYTPMFLQEVQILKRLNCPQIVRFESAYRDKYHGCILMEHCSGDSLIQRVVNNKYYTEAIASSTTNMMLKALKYLHDRDIVHCDIKPENFVYETRQGEALKLIDFGAAMDVFPDQSYTYHKGTPHYMAPEVVKHEDPRSGTICKRSDMWSLGVCVFLMVNGELPIKGSSQNALFDNILYQSKIRFVNEKISDDCKDFIYKLLERNPQKRLSVEEALGHKWIVKCVTENNENLTTTVEALRFFNLKHSVSHALSTALDGSDEKQYKQMFDRYDLNGDGNITKEECVQALELIIMYPQEAERMAEEMIKSCDENNDNMIQYNEFVTAMKTKRLSKDEFQLRAIFSALDINQDGFISKEDFVHCFPKGNDSEIEKISQDLEGYKEKKLSFAEFKKIFQDSNIKGRKMLDALMPQKIDQRINEAETDV